MKKKLIALSFAVLFAFCVTACGGDNGSTEDQTSSQTQTETAETEQESSSTKYDAGTYKVGSDISAGEYILFGESAVGAYYEIASDSTGTLESIITNGNFTTNAILTVSDGQYLKLQGCYAVPAEEVSELDTTKEGTFKIGTHLAAGEYKLAVDENSVMGSGYYEVASDSSGSLDSIVTNGNFEGETYITVSDGQYLKLAFCHIISE